MEVSSLGRVTVAEGGQPRFGFDAGQTAAVTPDGRGVRVEVRGEVHRFQSATFVGTDPERPVAVGGRPYRGVLQVFSRDGAVTAVERVHLEDYLVGVVPVELGPRGGADAQALRAQAVVSRTYALRNRGRYQAEGYDLRAGVSDQAYGGVQAESEGATAAVRGTAGQVLTFRGDLISAFFHSTCGYRTADPREAFRAIADLPYLRPVSDQRPGGYYCDNSPRFRWRVEWDAATLNGILRRTVPDILGVDAVQVGEIRDVRVHRTGRSGRVSELRVQVPRGEIPVYGPDVRQVLATPDGPALGSSAVQLTSQTAGGALVRLVAAGAGWGHGVGMCQWGAIGRSRAGQDYTTILATYFPGTRLERWY
ncbi:MAG TPA: SpoIID/LytB domain-containing protein [Gemmatimonadales bacterium]|nr:SpoIID/LytB domain-containing protein [Gemmatimonadales bacterium]